MSKTVRIGQRGKRLFIDFIFEKERPILRTAGRTVGMDSNYRNGFVFSDGQILCQDLYDLIRSFKKREKHTHAQIKSRIGYALKQIDFSGISTLCVENLKYVKHRRGGTFSRVHNRRLSHWLYAYTVEVLGRRCEELGIRLERKDPWKTSQFCRICGKWDRRNRVGDQFQCVHCGFSEQPDLNAARNLALLGVAGVYGLRSLPNSEALSEMSKL